MRALSGQFDSVKKEFEAPDTLFSMMIQPQEEWDMQFGRGGDISQGIPEAAMANLGKAMTMARGIVPKEIWNPNVLGEVNSTSSAETAKMVYNGVKTPVPQGAAVARASQGDGPRPKRNVKKRTYGDSSFEGYGEGYVDDDLQERGYSTGEGDDRPGGRKRPKKVRSMVLLMIFVADRNRKNAPSTHFQGPARQNSYGPGMVGA
jgi:hypothetical protein